MKRKHSLSTAVITAVTVIFVLLATGITVSSIVIAARDFTAFQDGLLRSAAETINNDWNSRKTKVEKMLNWFVSSPRVRDVIIENNHDGAVALGLEAMQAFGTDYFVFTKPDGVIVARAHDPDNWGDSIANQVTIQAAIAGRSLVALEEGRVVKLSLRGTTPVRNPNGTLAGIVSTGYTLSQNSYIDKWAEILSADITIFEGSTRLVSTITDAAGERIVGTTLDNPAIETTVLEKGQPYYGTNKIQGLPYTTVYLPIKNYSDKIVGMLFVGLPLRVIEEATRDIVIIISLVVAVLLVLSFFALLILMRGLLIKPLALATEALTVMAEGRSTTLDMKLLSRKDEIGTMSKSMKSLDKYLSTNAEVAIEISKGNLDVTPSLASENDRFGLAFRQMVKDLNRLVGTMKSVSSEVSEGVSQIADDTQVLSSGATESAASLEEMSASLQEILGSSRENTEGATKAAQDAVGINTSAMKSQDQMKNLLLAIGEMTSSAKEIQKIVKVIDDIAFQVNLLALNANVEAARAGKYGKGFGVVAEEVRALANRSAEAAKNTSEMVNHVLEKIHGGAEAAEISGKQLNQIVSGVGVITTSMGELARRSSAQNISLNQIGQGMDQLEKVTQNITATAEETAAASEEINSMAQELLASANRFRLSQTQIQQLGNG